MINFFFNDNFPFWYKDGELVWTKSRYRGRGKNQLFKKAGTKAGCKDPSGYVHIQSCELRDTARHRIIYDMFYNSLTKNFLVRHLNDIKGQDNIENLAMGTHSENNKDRIRNNLLQKNNLYGHAGVHKKRENGLWYAEYNTIAGGTRFAGYFKTKKEAVEARKQLVSGTYKGKILKLNNTSGCTGVKWRHDSCKWQVQIAENGERYHLGLYTEWWDAVCVRKSAEYAKYTNMLEEWFNRRFKWG